MAWYLYPLVVGAGFLCGFVNTLAGSGSAITLPLLIFMGLPATVANGTNRVAILLQNAVGASSFKNHNKLDVRGAILLAIPAVIGSIAGAQIAANLNEELMRRVIGIVMVVMLVMIVAQPKRWLAGTVDNLQGLPALKQIVLFLAIGFYGGFIQAGVGIFLLAGLVLGVGYELVRANAVKVSIIFLFTAFALAVFVKNGQVNWPVGLVLAVGNMMGARVGARFAVERGAEWVRRLLIVVVTYAALNFLGIFDLIGRLS